MLKAAHQRKFDIVVFWALDRLTREGTRATLNYLRRLESKGVGYVSYQEQWLDSTGPFKDVMIRELSKALHRGCARKAIRFQRKSTFGGWIVPLVDSHWETLKLPFHSLRHPC